MPHSISRDFGPADTQKFRIPTTAKLVFSTLALGLAGCASYKPDPIELSQVLSSLNDRQWDLEEEREGGSHSDEPGRSPEVLAAFAIKVNPKLAALRAQIGVRQSLLVEAGLLPNPELGWDAMDILASRIVDGTSSSVDALSGLGLMFPLFRPGERDALVGTAEWSLEGTRRSIARAEWDLATAVFLASEDLNAAEEGLAQTKLLLKVAESTNDYFRRARDAGTATGIQANLAFGELQTIRLNEVRAMSRLERSRQALNYLLGLPPDYSIEVVSSETTSRRDALKLSSDELTEIAIQRRPDLAELQAQYQISEEAVRLAVAKQYPMISIGTGISFVVPIFSRWGRPAIDTALAERERMRQEFSAAVHEARSQIAEAYSLLQYAEKELALVENELLPNAEKNLDLAQEAVREGELTLLESIALQGALVEARTRFTEVRAEKKKRTWILLAASGLLLENATTDPRDENEEATK